MAAAGALAPSGGNSQPWRFQFIEGDVDLWLDHADSRNPMDVAASNLVAGDTDLGADVFIYDRDSDVNGVLDDPGTIKVTLQGVPQLPLEWALTAADAYQNLRAALNYLAWELAKWSLAQRGETREPADATQFPINTKPR